jgi:hypothetical protein
LLRDGHILTADMFLDSRKEADVEDLLGRRFYVELVNRTYSLGAGNKLKTTKAKDAPERVVRRSRATSRRSRPASRSSTTTRPPSTSC